MSHVLRSIVRASPSLALMKYWGKSSSADNTPASPSLAMTLSALRTETRVWLIEGKTSADLLVLNGETVSDERQAKFFAEMKTAFDFSGSLVVETRNNFPTAAGLASSSSGFAAMVFAFDAALGANFSIEALSALARRGSGSAARSLFGGFTLFPAGAHSAHMLHEENFWPELRILLLKVDESKKPVSSRQAMETTRTTSPYFAAWVSDSAELIQPAITALGNRDLEALGTLMRKSYLRMFATMFAADPPVVYWKPESMALIHLASEMRGRGIPVWETMDAGPQVKYLTLEKHVPQLLEHLSHHGFPASRVLVDSVGGAASRIAAPRLLGEPDDRVKSFAADHGMELAP